MLSRLPLSHAPILTLLVALALAIASPGVAITVDDFAVPLPSPGNIQTDASGEASASQSALPGVLGGDRDTRVVAEDPGAPTDASMGANSNPPPITDVVNTVIGTGGGLLEVSYPGLSSYDLTLGGSGTGPSSAIVVRSTLMVTGAALRVTVRDISGLTSSADLGTVDFPGPGDHSYLYFVDPTTFAAAGLQLDKIDEVKVQLIAADGRDSALSDISLIPITPKTTDWSKTFAFQAAGGLENPAFLVGFNPQPEPPGDPDITVDMSDPKQPKLVLTGHPPDPIINLSLAPYGGLMSRRSTVVNGNQFEVGLTNGAIHRVVFDVTSSAGLQIDPGSIVGFNPQPEPPSPGSIVGFNPQPEPPSPGAAMGFEFAMPGGGGGAFAPAADTDTITLAFQVIDEGGDPIDLFYAGGVGVPFLSDWARLAFALSLIAAVSLASWREIT